MKPDLNSIYSHSPRLIGEDDFFKAAVCIPLLETAHDYEILFEVRSKKIPDQPGDVCLPGGALEPAESFEDACVRETCEELLIRPEQIRIIGEADILHVRNTLIRPFVGLLTAYSGTFSKAEVEEVFQVPLSYFLETEPEKYPVESIPKPSDDFPFDRIQGGRNYQWRTMRTDELFYEYDGHVIWGLTARLVHAFCRILSKED